jgi:hypothetical protein
MQSQRSLSQFIGIDAPTQTRTVKHRNIGKLHLRPEIELVLCCARISVDSDVARRIDELVRGEIDWDFTLRTSIAHGVMPLLYRTLSSRFSDSVPEEVLSQLRDYFRLHAQHNLLVTGELIRLIRLLESHGISVLPYKGPVLSASAYGDISLRVFSDLDILVRKQDIPAAKELLTLQGYRLSNQFTEHGAAAHLESDDQKDFAFVSKDGQVKVELHWQVASLVLFPLDAESLWERAEQMPLGGYRVRNLPVEDLLLVLCVHGAKHFFARLEWVCDVAELIRANPSLNWQQVVAQAGKLGTRRAFYSALLLVNEMLDAHLPEDILKDIYSDKEARRLAADMRLSLFQEPDKWSEVFDRGGHRIVLRDRLKDRMRVRLYFYARYLRIVLTPNAQDKETMSLPGSLSFLYYLIRPVRLAKSYGPTLIEHIVNRLKPRRSKISKPNKPE